MKPEFRAYGAGTRFLLAGMEGRYLDGLVDSGSWTGESQDQLDGQVPGVSWTAHTQEGSPAGLGCHTC